jgi:hypothetical protein
LIDWENKGENKLDMGRIIVLVTDGIFRCCNVSTNYSKEEAFATIPHPTPAAAHACTGN